MIPRLLHYCWFGPKPMPPAERRCLESWGRFLPGYEWRLWNEQTFDLSACPFAREAYDQKYYAFVSDYVRVKALQRCGGLYMDTDVELLKPIDDLLQGERGVLGFENRTLVGTALMALEANHPLMDSFAGLYENTPFLDESGQARLSANPSLLAPLLLAYGLKPDGKRQRVADLMVYEREVFFPKKISEEEFRTGPETVAIHRFSGSWLTERQRKRGTSYFWIHCCRPALKWCRSLAISLCGQKRGEAMETFIRNRIK